MYGAASTRSSSSIWAARSITLEMAALIAPLRRSWWSRGHFDGVAPDDRVALEFAKVRFFVSRQAEDRGTGPRSNGSTARHTNISNGKGTFEFLHKPPELACAGGARKCNHSRYLLVLSAVALVGVVFAASAPPAKKGLIGENVKDAEGLDEGKLRNPKAVMVNTPVLSPKEGAGEVHGARAWRSI